FGERRRTLSVRLPASAARRSVPSSSMRATAAARSKGMNVRIEIGRVEVAGLAVARTLHEFIEREALPGSGVTAQEFWSGLATLNRELGPRNRKLLALRDELQARIDEFHRATGGRPVDGSAYERFLRKIGYLLPEPADFQIRTADVDDEIATIAGPQLVVPLS